MHNFLDTYEEADKYISDYKSGCSEIDADYFPTTDPALALLPSKRTIRRNRKNDDFSNIYSSSDGKYVEYIQQQELYSSDIKYVL